MTMLQILGIGTFGSHRYLFFFFFFFFFAYDLGSLCIAFQGGNNMAYHVGLGQAAYDVLMNSLAWVCHVTQAYLSSY